MSYTFSASNLTSFAQWSSGSSSDVTDSLSTNHITIKRNKKSAEKKDSRSASLMRSKIQKQPTIFETCISKGNIPCRTESSTRQSRIQSRIQSNSKSRGKRQVFTAAGLVAVPERVICSVYESGKNSDTRVGLCVTNYSTAEMTLCEFIDSQVFIRTLNKLHVEQPTEVLLPSHSLKGTVSKLATLIRYNLPGHVKICEVSGSNYVEQEGIDAIQKLSLLSNSKGGSCLEEVTGKQFALLATCAAYKYMSKLSKDDPTLRFQNFRVRNENGDDIMLIDVKTIKSLELVQNALENKGMSLLKCLDYCVTRMGSRALRNNILQPLTDLDNLKLRHEAISELQERPEIVERLRLEFKGCHDLDPLFSKLLSVEHSGIPPDQKINYVILLKGSIEIAETLKKFFDEIDFQSSLLKEVHSMLSDPTILTIKSLIHTFINEDIRWASNAIDLQNQRAYAVKSGANGFLDVLRQLYRSITEEILNEIELLSEKHQLPIEYGFDSTRSYFLKVKRVHMPEEHDLDSSLINRVSKKATIEFSTLNLMKLNNRLQEVTSEILLLSDEVASDLLTSLVSYLSTLFMLSESISILDFLCSFAKIGIIKGWKIPHFGKNICLKSSYHPILQGFIKDFVPNDFEVIDHVSTFQIITGCNMSGKSIYLKQVALLTIMAQIGSPIPCDFGCFPIYKTLHARVCNDTMEINSSTFTSEMRDMAYFVNDISDSTLMIIDELGRGSSIGDGFSISLAISEYLLSSQCTVFLSTHFRDIPKILSSKPCVIHLEMKSHRDSYNQIRMMYKALESVDSIEGYGMSMCQKIFPSNVIEEAVHIANLIRATKSKSLGTMIHGNHGEKGTQIRQIRQIHSLVERLKDLLRSEKPLNVETLKQVQELFVKEFQM